MKTKGLLHVIILIVFIVSSIVISFALEKNGVMITSFEEGIPSFVTAVDSDIKISTNGATDGSKSLEISYHIADFPSVKFTAQANQPWNLTNNCLAFDITNPTDKAVTLYLRVDDDVNADGQNGSTTSVINIGANESKSYYLGFSEETIDLGMHANPPTSLGTALSYGWGEKTTDMNAANIVQFQFWMMYPQELNTILIDNIRILPDPSNDLSYYDGIVDKYGQYTKVNWDGKAKNDQDLINDKNEEAALLNQMTSPLTNVSKYGGWKGVNLGGTGYFRTQKYNGKWTLVDPEGYPYFATGVTCIRFDDAYTWISGRENMYNDIILPTDKNNPPKHFSYAGQVNRAPLGLTEGWIYNHYTANLERKYGSNYKQEWANVTIERMKDWGFTSLGNWSDPELFFGKGEINKIPYVVNAWINGNHAKLSSGSIYWGPISDPFDPEFEVSTRNAIDNVVSYGVNNDEWCIGIYVDNEIAWGNPSNDTSKYAVIIAAFKQDSREANVYAKKAFINRLKEKYNNNINNLNQVWNTNIDSWSTLEAPYNITIINSGLSNDLSELLTMLGEQYYRIVDKVLNEKMPNTLYLGSRFAEWGTSLELQKAAAKYVDVISYNVYYEDINQDWIYTDQIDMPMIVGEFHFGATDRGMFKPGLVPANNQEDRGTKYKQYITSVANSSNFVGAHWFQYTDQPLTGRAWDGENNNIGFVDVTDRPYDFMVNAAREIHSQIYNIRFN